MTLKVTYQDGERTREVRLDKSKVFGGQRILLCGIARLGVNQKLESMSLSLETQSPLQSLLVEELFVLQGRSSYKPEVSYDMTRNPPQPILDSHTGNSPHGWIPGWISKYWDDDPKHPPFKPGKVTIRRPDVVIVKDPSKPPTQDNIKQVVEMKFPPDPRNKEQMQDYGKIAGNKSKVAEMQSTECNCSQENQQSKVPVEELGWAAAIASGVVYFLTHGRSPRPMIPAY